MSQGKVELRKEQIALSELIKTAVEASNPLISAGRHELILDLPDAEVWLDADLTRLSQVVSNLLNNAAKYTPEGGRIVLSARRDRDEVLIAFPTMGSAYPPTCCRGSSIFSLRFATTWIAHAAVSELASRS